MNCLKGIFLAYLDITGLLVKKQIEKLPVLEVLRKLPIDVAAGLSIVPVADLSLNSLQNPQVYQDVCCLYECLEC